MAKQKRIKERPFTDKISIICGGSMGIGKATAREIVLLGGSVCFVARHPEPLEISAQEIEAIKQEEAQFVETIVCDAADEEKLKPLLAAFIAQRGVPDYLINCVGLARPRYVQELTLDDFRQRMEVNCFGQLVPIHILLPYFMEARKGHIANISSMMGYFGIMGYAAYAPTKFALAGLSEVLRHELRPYNIYFSVLYPPDTDTPGLQKENEFRPAKCAMIAGSVDLLSAQEVADAFVEGLLKKQFTILPGEAGWVWRLNRFAPWLLRRILDRKYQRALR